MSYGNVKGLGDNPMQQRRHITVDNIQQIIFIQVMFKLDGSPIQQEYWDIKNGNWWKYVPTDLSFREQVQKAIASGFRVVPFLLNGMSNEEYYIQQIVDIKESKVLTA